MTLRRAVTIIEVMVSIGIVAVIVAIVLPAVQSARETARRIQCENNLRQILLATQSIHAAEGALPSLFNGTELAYPLREWDLFHTHSWRVPMLPYLEQSALRDSVAWDALATATENAAVSQTVVPVLICPSGGDPSIMGWGLHHGANFVRPPDTIPQEDRYYVVRSDYDAMAGIQELPDPFPSGASASSVDFVHWGVWGWPVFEIKTISGSRMLRYRRGKFRDVTDGLSNTIAIVERGGKPIALLNGQPDVTLDNPDANYPGQVGWSPSNTFAWAINRDGVGVNQSNSGGIYSFHPGGANIALADGAIRFLAESTDFDTLVRLFGRSDGGLPQ